MPQTELSKGKAGENLGKEYLTDELTEQAIDFLRKRAALEQDMAKPFFLYLCHFAVHTPFQSQPEDVKYFENKPTRGWHGHDNAVYAAMLKRLEASVGQILDTLQHEGLDENTLVVLMSVNGGVMYTTPLATCNAPCQSGKVTHFEGGIRVPLIFRWKGHINGEAWSNVPVDCNDIFPSVLDLAGYDTAPFITDGGIDGRSLAPLFKDLDNVKQGYPRDTFF